jgi:ABC-type sugar transport system ATPase subunit
MRISTNNLMLPDDKWILMRDGKIVAVVERGAPIEDAEIDEMIVPQADYDEICARVTTQ